MKVAVVGTRYNDLDIERRILEPLGATLVHGWGGSDEDLLALAAGCEVVLAGSAPSFNPAVLKDLGCRAIVRYGVGVEKIDLSEAARQGIVVARVSDYGTEAVSLHALTLGLAGLRRLVAADRAVRRGDWGFAPLRPLHLPAALTVGIIGYGRIGRRTGELFAGIGAKVIAFDEFAPAPPPVRRGLEELLEESDLVSLHLPGAGDGSPLLGPEQLKLMREGSVLVNTARGTLIDFEALKDGLARNRPAVAAIDVFPAEPFDSSQIEEVADQLIMTPHMAWYTEESERRLRQLAAEEAARIIRGEPPLEPVSLV